VHDGRKVAHVRDPGVVSAGARLARFASHPTVLKVLRFDCPGHSVNIDRMYPKGIKLFWNVTIASSSREPDHADHGNAGFPALTFFRSLVTEVLKS
jgi:hypothetical protein